MNILWILCDELRADALSCYGGAPVPVHTPNIDGIAHRGVLFERCYANSPVCVPARVAMHTGLLAEQTGVYHNEAFAPGYPMAPVLTFPEVLAGAGWATADFGKEHVPDSLRPWSLQDPAGAHMLDLLAAAPDVAALDLLRAPMGGIVAGRFPAATPYPASKVVDNVLGWAESTREPFLVRASLLQPHAPVLPPEPWASRYDDEPWPDEIRPAPLACAFERRFGEICGGARLSAVDLIRAQAAYHGTVAWIDNEIGRLLAGFDSLGLSGRTAVVFSSDHGHLLGEQGAIGKQTHAPASQQIPLIIDHPDLPVSRRSDLAQQVDLPRSFCAMAGVDTPPEFGGRDLFGGGRANLVFSTIGYGEHQSCAFPNLGLGRWVGDRGWPRRSCVRTERWRYDRNVRIDGRSIDDPDDPDADSFLADSLHDPDEVVNIVDDPSLAGVVESLSEALSAQACRARETPADVVYTSSLPGVR